MANKKPETKLTAEDIMEMQEDISIEETLFADFDSILIPETPEEGSYSVTIKSIKALKGQQLEISVEGGEGIAFTFKWFATSLIQNLQKVRVLFREETWAKGSTAQLISNLIGKEVTIEVTYNGVYTNYNLV